MPLSTDVKLPRDHAARFPTKCVECGEDPATSTVRLWTHTLGWWSWVLAAFGSGVTVTAPACVECGWRIRIQRIGGVLVTAIIALAFLFLIWPYVEDLVARPIRKWVALGLCLICLAPYIAWEIFFPPSFEITAYAKSIDYEFRDEEYAMEFAELNDDAEWVEIT